MRRAKWAAAVIVGVLLAVVLAGCAAASGGDFSSSSSSPSPSPSSSSSSSSSPQPIAETWQFVTGSDANGTFSPDGAVVTLKIDGVHSGGQGPCNAFGATVTGSMTGTISIVVGIHTMMACSEAVRNVTESRYFAALGKVTHSSISSGDLTLTGDNVRLVFSRART
jgi:heat shock protein HslJ